MEICLPYFQDAIHNLKLLLSMEEEEFNQILAKEINLYKQDKTSFFSEDFLNTLSCVIAQEACMLLHGKFMISYLEKHGFDHVELTRKHNPYNGRKNVWMISAVRNNNPLPTL